MKYFNFKRNKFSTIIRNINLDKPNFKWIYRYISTIKEISLDKTNFKWIYGYISTIKKISLDKLNLKPIYKIITKKEFIFFKPHKDFNFKKINFTRIYKDTYYNIYIYFKNLKRKIIKANRYFLFYFLIFTTLAVLIYSSVPIFYEFDKKYIQDLACKDANIKCEIKGKINYTIFPSPRIKVRDLEIKDIANTSNTLVKIPNVELTVSFSKLLKKDEINIKNIKIDKGIINFNLDHINFYKEFFQQKSFPKPINFKNGKIIFFEEKHNVASVENLNLVYKINKNSNKIVLKGDFLGDKLNVVLKNNKKENLQRIFEVKLPGLNIFSKGKIFKPSNSKKTLNGNILIKNFKNRITGFFEYEKGKILFKKASIRSNFLDGSFVGSISFLPYFNFDLDFELDSLNFTKFQTSIVNLDKNKNPFFEINNKLNGILNITSNNVFSKSSLVDSFESKLSFINGDILIDKLLLNIQKIGAADLTGAIRSNNKFTNLKFESNIFIDNLKKFYSKFGIYKKNKEKKPLNLFLTGNIDLINLVLRLTEIDVGDKINEEDLLYIEKEFNKVLFRNRYESFFNFKNLKEFLKLIIEENS